MTYTDHPSGQGYSSAFIGQSLAEHIILNQVHVNQQDGRELAVSEAARKGKGY